MSDFLGNLAMKSLGLAPLVQPRPLTAFEALPAEGALAARAKGVAELPAEPMELSSEVVGDTRPSTHLPQSRGSARVDAPSVVSVPGAEIERPGPAQSRAISLPPVRAEAEAQSPPALAPFERASDEGERRGVGERPAAGVPQPEPVPAILPAVDAQHLTSLKAPARPVAAPASEDQAEALQRRGTLTPAVEEIRAGPILGKPIAAQAEGLRERAESAAAPTISVTIGRVEVRAAIAPRPSPEPRREKRRGPSLDDYLRARSGGKP